MCSSTEGQYIHVVKTEILKDWGGINIFRTERKRKYNWATDTNLNREVKNKGYFNW